MCRERVSLWDRLNAGEIVAEKKITRLTRPPKGVEAVNWKEVMIERNRENICNELKRQGYENSFVIRRWFPNRGEYLTYLRIDGLDMGLILDGAWSPIWDMPTIQKVLSNRKQIKNSPLHQMMACSGSSRFLD